MSRKLTFDIHATKVILIATSEYESDLVMRRDEVLPNRPQVKKNAERFKKVLLQTLVDQRGNQLKEEQITTLYDVSEASQITQKVQSIVTDRNLKFLIVLYTGHGISYLKEGGGSAELLLTVSGTTTQTSNSELHPGKVLKSRTLLQVLQKAKNAYKLIILDACHSGLVSWNPDLSGHTTLIASCGANEKAHQDVFMPALIKAWQKESSDGTLASIEDIFDRLPNPLTIMEGRQQQWENLESNSLAFKKLPLIRTTTRVKPKNTHNFSIEFVKTIDRDNEIAKLEQLLSDQQKIKVSFLHGQMEDCSLNLVDRFITENEGKNVFMPRKENQRTRLMEPVPLKIPTTLELLPFKQRLAKYVNQRGSAHVDPIESLLMGNPERAIVINLVL